MVTESSYHKNNYHGMPHDMLSFDQSYHDRLRGATSALETGLLYSRASGEGNDPFYNSHHQMALAGLEGLSLLSSAPYRSSGSVSEALGSMKGSMGLAGCCSKK